MNKLIYAISLIITLSILSIVPTFAGTLEDLAGILHYDSSRVCIEEGSYTFGVINVSNINGITDTELGYLAGVTSNIQTQINSINNTSCPIGYSCPKDYTELVSMAINSSITHIWLNPAYTYAESGAVDLDFTNNDKVVKGNGAVISFDTTECTGGSVQLDTENNYEFWEVEFDFNGCDTGGLSGLTPNTGAGSLSLYQVTLRDIDDEQSALYWWGKDMYVWKSNFINVCSALKMDHVGDGGKLTILDSTFEGNRTACGAYDEGEGIEINHANISVTIINSVFGNKNDASLAFQQNSIDCNGIDCYLQGNTIYNDPTNPDAITIIFTDLNYQHDVDYKVLDNVLYGVCDQATGIEVGATGTGNMVGLVSGNTIYGCEDGTDGDNTGIRADGDMTQLLISNNYINGLWRGIRTASANVTLSYNEVLRYTDQIWEDDAVSAWRATNIRVDRSTVQPGLSGYVCNIYTGDEWEMRGGQSSC